MGLLLRLSGSCFGHGNFETDGSTAIMGCASGPVAGREGRTGNDTQRHKQRQPPAAACMPARTSSSEVRTACVDENIAVSQTSGPALGEHDGPLRATESEPTSAFTSESALSSALALGADPVLALWSLPLSALTDVYGSSSALTESSPRPSSTTQDHSALLPRFSRLARMRAQVETLSLLGRGGQAIVLRGVWQLADVAVKLVVTNPASASSTGLPDLLLEGPLSKCLRAPNVVETFCYSCTQLSLGDIQDCQAADEPALDHVSRSAPSHGWGSLREGSFTNHLPTGQLQYDSFDGFGGLNQRNLAALAMTYTDALSAAGAAPGCYLTQIIMELCDQGSLVDLVERGAYTPAAQNRLALFAYLRTLHDIAAGMSYLHFNGVLHGDLKPGNVLLRSSRCDSRGYQAKVSDFGLSHFVAGVEPSAATAADWTSYPYMAPEHFDGVMVRASDVWSFAATAHHMWTGEVPHAGLHPMQVCAGVCDGSLRLEALEGMPPVLWRLLQACMVQAWQRRPSFQSIRVALREMETSLCGA